MQNADDMSNNDLALAGFPYEVWREILKNLGTEDEQIAHVSHSLNRAWREGVMGICIHFQSPIINNTLLGNQRINRYPNLNFIHIDNQCRLNKTKAPSPAGSPYLADKQLGLSLPLNLSLSLNLESRADQKEAYRLLRQNPNLARRVTCLSLNGHSEYSSLAAMGLNDNDDPTLRNLWQLVAILPNLLALNISKFQDFCDEALTALGTSPHLAHLTIRNSENFSDDTLGKLGALTSLKYLKVHDSNSSLTGAGFEGLFAGAPGIESLYIDGLTDDFHADHLRHLSPATELRELTLISSHFGQRCGINFSEPSQIQHLSHCTSLSYLMLINASLSDECIRSFATALAQLEVLELTFCEDFTQETLAALHELKRLRRLSLLSYRNRFTPEGIAAFASAMPALGSIHISLAGDDEDEDEGHEPFVVTNGSGNRVFVLPPGVPFS